MPNYIYACRQCMDVYEQNIEEGVANNGDFDSLVLFETSHKMNPTDEELQIALKCPRCGSTDAMRTMYGVSFSTYVRGYGWKDKNGIHRDMHTHKLLTDDPYAQYRQNGEVDHIKETLQKKGKTQNNPSYFTSTVNEGDVAKAVYNNE